MAKPKGKKHVKITILYGLPACGKSTFASENPRTPVIDFDEIIKSNIKSSNKFSVLSSLNEEIDNRISYRRYPNKNDAVIIDGLVTTNSQLRDIIDSITANFPQFTLNFELVYWNEDREACLHNDQGRRSISSETSIKNLPYEKPNLELFPELSQKRVQARKVVRKSLAIAWISALLSKLEYAEWDIERVLKSMKIESSTWCLGGTWGGWDGSSGTVEATSPIEFDQFDKILELACPNIGFLAYKRLKAQCCTTPTEYDRDYYGGSTTNMRHVCDVQKLYDGLNEMGLI